jgi:hypothetical protein
MINILKLCVGANTVEDLERWRDYRLESSGEHFHTTRMFPKRKDGLLAGGSLYWVIKGQIQARQRLLDLREVKDADGIDYCNFILEPVIHLTQRRVQRPFQGWRYLKPEDAPLDILSVEDEMSKELAEIGVL